MYVRPELTPAPGTTIHDELLTADEVAALLRMTPGWVYAETRRNRIPHMRLGRYCRYRRSTIEAWMATLEAGSTASGRKP
jgi:excisionase family DNA binding protein